MINSFDKLTRTLIIATVAVGCSLFGPISLAASVPIVNAGFEDDATGSGVPTGWSLYDPNAITPSYAVGVFDPDGVSNAEDFYVGLPPEGTNVAWTFIDFNFNQGPFGIEQTLTSNLMPNSQYNLSVAIGNPQTATSPRSGNFIDYTGITSYTIQLLAGGNVVAEDVNSLGGSIAEGTFATASLTYETGNADPLLGLALGIRLINQNDLDLSNLASWASEVDFDNVQLSVSAVPVPAAVWLFGTALIGLVGFANRRKAA